MAEKMAGKMAGGGPEKLPIGFAGLGTNDLPPGVQLKRGKVRDSIDLGEQLVIVTSDRVSAFDQVLAVVPYKGEILNRLSLFWFKKTADIVENHINEELSARTVVVKKATVLPIEVVVRGYLTGSAWRDYAAGKSVSGVRLPSGLEQYQQFDSPLVTPSTKEQWGTSAGHDRPISREEIIDRGIVPETLYREVEETALRLFARGTTIAAARGLILVDTKYEFGLINGRLTLVDEVHTPDSSRYWYADDYRRRIADRQPPRRLDKEFLRAALMEQGYMGDGPAPEIPPELIQSLSERYQETFSVVTGRRFESQSLSIEAEKEVLRSYLVR